MIFYEKYKKEVALEMNKKFNYKNLMSVPKINKVVVNTGFGRLVCGKTKEEEKKIIDSINDDLLKICGQKPVFRSAKHAIASFKSRRGQIIGMSATLRGKRMYDFLSRLINIALPRTRDFQGIPVTAFDKKGNLTIGVKEQISFPEISPEKTKFIFGLQAIINIKAKSREESIEFCKLMGFPIAEPREARQG